MSWRRLIPISVGLVVLGAGCNTPRAVESKSPAERQAKESQNVQDNALYFESPSRAVPIISELLRKEDWVTLSRYYDLQGSSTESSELLSGAFFVRQQPPEAAHPGGFWRYKHPFPPSFKYQSHSRVDDEVVVVTVGIEIDQGGGMVQRGTKQFKMRKGDQGWRILPDQDVSPAPPSGL